MSAHRSRRVEALRALVEAFGGNPPDWLLPEYNEACEALNTPEPLHEAAPDLRMIREAAKTYDDDMNAAERAPTGDDYNALFSMIMSDAPSDLEWDAKRAMLLALKTITLHAPSLDVVGIRELADEAIAKAEGRTNG